MIGVHQQLSIRIAPSIRLLDVGVARKSPGFLDFFQAKAPFGLYSNQKRPWTSQRRLPRSGSFYENPA
jgi:hypothetical protein